MLSLDLIKAPSLLTHFFEILFECVAVGVESVVRVPVPRLDGSSFGRSGLNSSALRQLALFELCLDCLDHLRD